MSTTELERRVTDVLHRHAEEAMSETNTEQRLVELLDNTRDDNHRRRWVVGGLVAAAAAAAVVGWLAVRDTGGDKIEPAPPLSPQQVATEYLHAAAAYDLAGAESYLASDADLQEWGGVEGWRAVQFWNQAVFFEMEPGRCTAEDTVDPAVTQVTCPYVFTGLGSKELGLAPFHGSSYLFRVEDGEIVSLVDQFEYSTNSYSRSVWEPFWHWVKRHYPEDYAVMYANGGSDYVTTDESIRLWHEHLIQYIAAKLDQ